MSSRVFAVPESAKSEIVTPEANADLQGDSSIDDAAGDDRDGAESAHPPSLADQLLADVARECREQAPPEGTYRLQFNADFGFRAANRIVDYLRRLGISHLYASPYLQAQSGSLHGYDTVDHRRLNREIGDEADFAGLITSLRSHGMGHILDVVPNHMGVGSDENPWWQHVLENGPSSQYAQFFDIDWQPLKSDLNNKVLLPVLGDQFGNVLEAGQLTLKLDDDGFAVEYYKRRFPIAMQTVAGLLRQDIEQLEQQLGAEHPALAEYQSILTAISHLPSLAETDAERILEGQREKEVIKRRIARLRADEQAVADFLERAIQRINGQPGQPQSFDQLDQLLAEQAYRLSYWRVASDEINYRRFFDVNELAAVCMERPEVFEQTHEFVLKLLNDQQLDGLRIDHADGLYDPTAYLWQLQERRFLQQCRRVYDQKMSTESDGTISASTDWDTLQPFLRNRFRQQWDPSNPQAPPKPLYLVVEKILEGPERLPADWPVHGTTGYEFMNRVNGLLVATGNEKVITKLYARFINDSTPFTELVYHSKRLIMKVAMSSELHALGHRLDRISEQDRRSRDYTLAGLIAALREIVACFPVYRTYTTAGNVLERDRRYIEQAVAQAKRRNPATNQAVFDFIRSILLLDANENLSGPQRDERLQFIGRFQQFTGPMMAKSVEDTAFYVYNRLSSLNEVGGDPQHFGETVESFHRFNSERHSQCPLGLLATSTHDGKRSEDVRARISVLSELPAEWKEHLLNWARWNKRKAVKVEGRLAPSRNEEYLLYQTLLGSWPLQPPQGEQLTAYITRIQQYMNKALREAKTHTSWIAPDENYERAVSEFVAAILPDDPNNPFVADLSRFAQRISKQGMWNSLSQTLIKLTSPGVPDIYQGTEIWDFSLVDPDNRRAVDFKTRDRLLHELDQRLGQSFDPSRRDSLADELLSQPEDGRIKLYLTSQVLRLRQRWPKLFSLGDYLPLSVSGAAKDSVCAFARRDAGNLTIIIAPVCTALLSGPDAPPPCGAKIWGDTRILVPPTLTSGTLTNLFTGQSINVAGELRLADVLSNWPVALLVHTM